jgi:hypothetical protein
MGEERRSRRSRHVNIAPEPRRYAWEAHVVAVQTDEVLEDVEPPKEPPEMSDVEQALITLMDYTKSTAAAAASTTSSASACRRGS